MTYLLEMPDNGFSYFADAPKQYFCSICDSYIEDRMYVPDGLGKNKIKYDISSTYDNRIIFSQRAKDVFGELDIQGTQFVEVDSASTFYLFEALNVVQFDCKRAGTRFEGKCEQCGNYESVVGIIPPFLVEGQSVANSGICKTNLDFGSGREKTPALIVGDQLKTDLEKLFKELDFYEFSS